MFHLCGVANHRGPVSTQLFSSDVNSPLKQTQQNQQNKDGGPGPALNGRKTSVSQGLSSPSGVSRPATRRRETTDTNPFPGGGLTSPTSAGPGRQFEGTWFNRRSTDLKESEPQEDEKQQPLGQDSASKSTAFAGLARSNTAGAAGFPGAPWGAATTTPTASAFGGGFGNFALNTPVAADKGSRFFSKKDSAENVLGGAGPSTSQTPDQLWRPRPRTDTDPFGGEEATLSGSAALGGARDTSPPPMPTTHGSEIFDTPAKGNASDFGMSGLNLGSAREGNASSASPSQTNPFRSPPAERGDHDRDDLGFDNGHHTIGGQSGPNSRFGSVRGFSAGAGAAAFEGSDRSQTSSVGAKNNYPALANISGWPAAFSTGTPDRERGAGFGGAFGNSMGVFSPMSNDMQSPGLGGGGMGNLFGPASSGLGGPARGGSKLNALFPPAMQAQMQSPDHDPLADSIPDIRHSNPLNAIGAGAIGPQSRDTDSPMPLGRGGMDAFSSSHSQVNSPGLYTTADHNQPLHATASQGPGFGAATPQGVPFGAEQPAGGVPQSQKTMVMPDRMRWIYMDPQGQQQGPFTGLEMNEWYKGNFFTNDLRVRKLEDSDFEPLGQLIRRIGNSREPFLVPQVGVAHGAPQQTGPFAPGGDNRGVIPPLVGVVPSYGKTLTAEEQNNLERRKQEEQVAMARQREFMAQQNHYRPMHPGVGVPGALQHQASMHSLQSQPSFGSITSPIGMPPQAPIGASMGGPTPTQGFFDQANPVNRGAGPAHAVNAGPDPLRGDYSEQDRQMLASLHGPGGASGMFPPQPVGPPTADLKSQLPSLEQLERDPEGFKERLKEFQDYQGIPSQLHTDEEVRQGPSQTGPTREEAEAALVAKWSDAAQSNKHKEPVEQHQQQSDQQNDVLSLTQQVQKAQAEQDEARAKQAAATGLPMPFPAPVPSSHTPLAAPTAQRRANIADQYIDTRSQPQTPDSAAAASASAAQPPPLAPWARESRTETQKKGPSLKEIQEAEAVRTAEEEARRRAQQEQEALAAKEREKANPVAVPGLPQHSTWGSASPAPASSSPWAKPAPAKIGPAAALPVLPKHKTLSDIQREEEEANKAKLAREHAAKSGMAAGIASMGKRYADLASKTGPPGIATVPAAAAAAAAPAPPSITGGWSTVGAGGKVKVPMGPQPRSVSAATVRTPVSPQVAKQTVAAVAVRPAVATSPASVRSVNTVSDAHAALANWLKSQLLRGAKSGISVDHAVNITMDTTDKEIVESIFYQTLAADTSIHPPQLASEYLRRKKQAEKGVFEPAPTSDAKSGAGGGGWSEVAKKGGSSANQQPREMDVVGAGFKVVNKKKGKK